MVPRVGGSTHRLVNKRLPTPLFLKVLSDLKVALVLYVKALASNVLQ